MAAGFHERKVNRDIFLVMKNLEFSEMNHPPPANHNLSFFSNLKKSFKRYFLHNMVYRKQESKFYM